MTDACTEGKGVEKKPVLLERERQKGLRGDQSGLSRKSE